MFLVGKKYPNTEISLSELRCACYLLRGKTLPQIADSMGLILRSVEFNVKNLQQKLGCATLQELIEVMTETRIIEYCQNQDIFYNEE